MRYLVGFVFTLALGVVGCSGSDGGGGGNGGQEVGAQCAYPEGEISNDEYFQGVRCKRD